MIQTEEQVFDLGKNLSFITVEKANKYKAELWLAWSDLQRLLNIFNSINLDQAKINEITMKIKSLKTEATFEIRCLRDYLQTLSHDLSTNLTEKIQTLRDDIGSDMQCTLKGGHRDNPPIVVIAENNILDEIDMSIECHV